MNQKVQRIEITKIKLNPNQPRKSFDEDSIRELAESIKTNGLIQPIVVRKAARGYELVAGERRLRACYYLGLKTIGAVVQEYDDQTSARIAIIENIQRENLSAIEEAIAYEKLIKDLDYTQQELADSLGKSQSTIANKIRLLNLTNEVKQSILQKTITERHGRALLKIDDQIIQNRTLEKIIKDKMNVEQTEKYISKIVNQRQKPLRKGIISKSDYRLEVNTVIQSLDLIRKNGVSVEFEMKELNDGIKLEIIMKK